MFCDYLKRSKICHNHCELVTNNHCVKRSAEAPNASVLRNCRERAMWHGAIALFCSATRCAPLPLLHCCSVIYQVLIFYFLLGNVLIEMATTHGTNSRDHLPIK